MKERPIIFKPEMVRAILDGNKTMTRRIIKPQPDDSGVWNDTKYPRSLQSTLKGWNGTVKETGESKEWKCPYGLIGDVLWVRETWQWDWKKYPERTEKDYFYKADTSDIFLAYGEKWRPSIHMPREACRLRLQITDIKVEKVQDISEEDAIKEGVANLEEFKELWISISGHESWDSNPFVWALTFKVL